MVDKNKIMDRLSGPGMVTPSLAEGQPDQMDTVRDIEIITGEILEAKRVGGEAVLTIGRGLIEAKALLSHGEWLPWLNDRVEFSERTAQNFMRLAREWSNPHALADLGARKALQLLALPESEREEFLSGTHTVDGEEKSVVDMTSRELERVIKEKNELAKERDEARKAAEQAKAAWKTVEELRKTAREEEKQASDRVAELEKYLAELKATPVDVAVMQVDQEQLDKARAEGAAEKEAQLSNLQAKLDKAKAAQKEAEEKQKEAESSVEDMKRQLEEAEKAKEEAVAQERKKVAASDPDMAAFRIYFDQIQATGNKLRGLLIKARKREDQDTAGKLVSALTALGEMLKEAAK